MDIRSSPARCVLAVLGVVLVPAGTGLAQGGLDGGFCPGSYAPVPVEVAVNVGAHRGRVHGRRLLRALTSGGAGAGPELPVAVTLGEAGTTTLSEKVEALPADRYRVEKYLVTDPADVDRDCIDDLTELSDPVVMNPVNPAPAVALWWHGGFTKAGGG